MLRCSSLVQPAGCAAAGAAAAGSSAGAQPRPLLRPRRLARGSKRSIRRELRASSAASAAAATAAAAAAEVLFAPGYDATRRRAPLLHGRHLPLNPLQGLAELVEGRLLPVELAAAQAVDGVAWRAWAAMAASAAMAATGLCLPALLARGLPSWAVGSLYRVGVDTQWPVLLAALGVGAAASAWALRTWWVACLAVARSQVGLSVMAALQRRGLPLPDAGSAKLLSWALVAGRGVLLAAAWGLLCGGAGAGAAAAAGGAGAALVAALGGAATCVAAAAAVLLLPRLLLGEGGSGSGSAGGGGAAVPADASTGSTAAPAAPLLPTLLGLEIALLAASAPALPPLARAAAGAAVGVALASAHAQAVAPRLRAYLAEPGDEVEVHVELMLQGEGSAFDTTRGGAPLTLTVLAPAADAGAEAGAGSTAAAGGAAAAAAAAASSTAALSAADQRLALFQAPPGAVPEGLSPTAAAEAVADARWTPLAPLLSQAAAGLFLGRTASAAIPPGHFWSPLLRWWQPLSEVQSKFRGSEGPLVGDVFLYPIADDAWLQVRVNAVGEQHLEMDGNHALINQPLTARLTLVKLAKRAV